MTSADLRAFMARHRIKSRNLAEHVELSKQYIDMMRCGQREVSQKVIDYINNYKGEYK